VRPGPHAKATPDPAHRLRKRLEVARALATRPRLLLLDEVMAGLNPTELAAMIELIQHLHGDGLTVIVIEHIMAAMMRLARRIVVLHHGERIAEGPRPRSHRIGASSTPISARSSSLLRLEASTPSTAISRPSPTSRSRSAIGRSSHSSAPTPPASPPRCA